MAAILKPTLTNQWQLAPELEGSNTSASDKKSAQQSASSQPLLKLSVHATDGTGTSTTLKWTIEYHTDYPIKGTYNNSDPGVFVTLSHSEDKTALVSRMFYLDVIPVSTKKDEWHRLQEGEITFDHKQNDRDVTFLLEYTWDQVLYERSENTWLPPISGVLSPISKKILAKSSDSASTGDGSGSTSTPAGGDPDSANTSEIPLWEADWSQAVIFDLDGSAATSAPPKPTVRIESAEDGGNPTLVIAVNKKDIFKSSHRVKLVFEVIKDGIERRYSAGDIVRWDSDEDATSELGITDLEVEVPVELGSYYNARCRTIKIVGDKQYESEWSELSDKAEAAPLAPEQIRVCRAASSNGSDVDSVYLEWAASTTAKSYDIQYSTDKNLMDDSNSNKVKVVNTGDVGTKFTLTFEDSESSGKEYFLRIRAVGANNATSPWSGIVSVILGTKPAAPTTWSSQSTITVGEPVDLYWVHNSMDGSSETYANLIVTLDNSIKFFAGMEVYKDYCYTDGTSKYLCLKDSESTSYNALQFTSGMNVVEGYYYTDGADTYLCRQNGSPESLTNTDFFTKINENPMSLTDTTFFEQKPDNYGETKILDTVSIYRTVTFVSGMAVTEGRYYTDGVDKYICIRSSTETELPTTLLDDTFFTKVAGGYNKDEVSFYTLETPETLFSEGARVKWKVATAGITNTIGPYSELRVIDVYVRPSVQLTVTKYVNGDEVPLGTEIFAEKYVDGMSVLMGRYYTDGVNKYRCIKTSTAEEMPAGLLDPTFFVSVEDNSLLTTFPIHIKAPARPISQTPIGYYLSVISKGSYTTRDAIGNPKVVHEGDIVYYKYFDTSETLNTHLSAGDITLENNISYEISCIASMNSGLTAEGKADFTVSWSTEQHLPNASIAINTTTYAASILPYCEKTDYVWYTVNKEDDGRYTIGSAAGEGIDDIVPLVKSVEPLGKNLLNIAMVVDSHNCTTSILNGELSITRSDVYTAYARLESMYLTADKTYVLSYIASSPDAKVYWWKVDDSHYDDDNDDLTVVSTMNTYTPSESGYYCIAFGHTGAQGTTITIRNAQVEAGSKATSYEEYQGVDIILEKTSTGVDIYTSISGENYYCILKEPKLVDDVTLSVYRREYDGSFTEIAKNIPNRNVYIPDPHPSLDYARYRIVATSKTTGHVSYYDLPSRYVGCKSVVIQWDEEWNDYDADKGRTEEKTWTGSLLTLPYNIDVSDSRAIEVEMVKYIGRKHPVSYYGTHLGETASWSCSIPKTDKEILYALRRLATWAGDVYVREPSGVGYWANVVVNFSQKHCDPVVPVSFEITRVEGGM